MTEPAKWSTTTTTREDGTTIMARRLTNGPDGISVTIWRTIIEGTPHDSVVVRVDNCPEPRDADLDMRAAGACRQIAARLLEAADSIALALGVAAYPGAGTAARDDDHAIGRDPLATATPGQEDDARLWCPDCGPETGTHPECDACGDAASQAK